MPPPVAMTCLSRPTKLASAVDMLLYMRKACDALGGLPHGKVITRSGETLNHSTLLVDGYACNVNGLDFVRKPGTRIHSGDNIAIIRRAPERIGYLHLKDVMDLVAPEKFTRPVPAKRVAQDTPGQHKEQYHGSEDSLLTIWRVGANGPVNAFEYRMRQCYARGAACARISPIS